MDTAEPQRTRRRTLIALIVITAVFLLSLFPAALFVMMSPMVFDSGASPQAWMVVIPIWLYPFAVLVSLVGSWTAFAARRHRFAIIWSLFPLLDVAFLAAVFALLG